MYVSLRIMGGQHILNLCLQPWWIRILARQIIGFAATAGWPFCLLSLLTKYTFFFGCNLIDIYGDVVIVLLLCCICGCKQSVWSRGNPHHGVASYWICSHGGLKKPFRFTNIAVMNLSLFSISLAKNFAVFSIGFRKRIPGTSVNNVLAIFFRGWILITAYEVVGSTQFDNMCSIAQAMMTFVNLRCFGKWCLTKRVTFEFVFAILLTSK